MHSEEKLSSKNVVMSTTKIQSPAHNGASFVTYLQILVLIVSENTLKTKNENVDHMIVQAVLKILSI